MFLLATNQQDDEQPRITYSLSIQPERWRAPRGLSSLTHVLAEVNRVKPFDQSRAMQGLQQLSSKVAHDAFFLAKLQTASTKTGNVVQFPSEFGYVPTLVGSDNRPVLLRSVVEEIESIIDPDEICERFPALSYTQVVCALMFLRKLSQLNTRDLDLDDVEDGLIEGDAEFQRTIADSLDNLETRRVHSGK